MKIIPFLFTVVVIGAFSCSGSDPSPAHFSSIDSVSATYMIDREQHFMKPSVGGTAHFRYRNGKFLERSGGYMPVPGSTGVVNVYTTSIYDSVQYPDSNTILITTLDNLDGLIVYYHNREITLENERMKRKITVFENASQNDTLYYFYDSRNRIQRTEQRFTGTIVTREYFFEGGNLQRITGTASSRADGLVLYTSEETFGGYDDTPNPLKGLCLWQDLYYRSLSTNNFTTYSFESEGVEESATWTLVYDDRGRVDYSK